tara:strand:- start:113 stop:628 length:516 start_codon:yes stop_codon:yes gene_type:complete
MDKLKEIMDFVIRETTEDITSMSREQAISDARAIYCKLAREHTNFSFKAIGESIGRNHATVIHAVKNVFPTSVLNNRSCKRAYNKYNNIVEGVTDEDVNLIAELKDRIKELEDSKRFTLNEQLYRNLDSDDKKVYDERANLVLKSFAWKKREANRKEDFEVVNCYSRLECF